MPSRRRGSLVRRVGLKRGPSFVGLCVEVPARSQESFTSNLETFRKTGQDVVSARCLSPEIQPLVMRLHFEAVGLCLVGEVLRLIAGREYD